MPGKPQVITTSKDSVTLQWTRPEEDGGNDIFNYALERREKGGQKWIRVNKRVQITELHYRCTGLSKGSEHQFRVSAENNAGLSYFSDESIFVKVLDPTFVPAAPSSPRIVDMTKNSLTCRWNTPLYDGDSPILGYVIETALIPEKDVAIVDEGEEAPEIKEEEVELEWERTHISKFIAQNSHTVGGLEANRQYQIRVFAVNAVGVSDKFALLSSPVTTRDILEAPEFDNRQYQFRVLAINEFGTGEGR